MSDGQNFDPTNRWVLFGHHFAAISGAGPLIGPVLAIQFGYLPGLVWLVVGVCLAGAVQDMMVLAASTRRDGLSLAGIARVEIGRPAGIAAAISILYIVIIALAGLGIVVVKALGGEQVAMKAGTVLVYPEGGEHRRTMYPGDRPDRLSRSARIDLSLRGRARATRWSSTSRSISPCRRLPAEDQPGGRRLVLPENTKRLVPGSSWGTFTIACTIPIALFVGWYMYRFRKGKVLEASLLGAAAVLAATCRRGTRPRLAARAVLLALAGCDRLRAGSLRLRGRGAAGLALALPRATTSRRSSRSARSCCWSSAWS